jgi:hypothetical protein
MGVSTGCLLKALAVFFIGMAFLLVVFTGMEGGRAEARANLTAFTTAPPNSWEPMGYNVTGTAPWLMVQAMGWNAFKLMGNVGIGDGSVRTLNGVSNRDVNYTDNNLMAADVSLAPWDPGRLTALSTPPGGNPTEKTEGNATMPGLSGLSFSRPLNDPYHPILLGRPVDDLLYEYPLATSVNMYGRLLGLSTPGGPCVNIGVKCLGYGY